MSQQRILVIAHAHPDHSLGGGELAAYGHFRELQRQGVQAMFLARSSDPSGHAGTPFTARTADGSELLFHLPPVDHFRHSQPERSLIHRNFCDLLERFQPTAVHFHHYVHLGVELIREVRRWSADIPIVLTLHDYLGICHAQGQMLKTNGILCQRATPLDCHHCFREITPPQFFMRELWLKSFFALVDIFVSPSQFLRDRYVAWGLPAERFLVLENGQQFEAMRSARAQPAAAPAVATKSRRPRPAADSSMQAGSGAPASAGHGVAQLHTRFLVLGQLSRLKGTPVLIDAVRALAKDVAKAVRIEIHGTIQHAPQEFQQRFLADVAELAPTLRYCGPYLPGDVDSIIATAGWLVVPSIWWENSPMVIQEACRNGRPVISSNIGGMAEKVQPGVHGLHFRVGSAADLARAITEAASDAERWHQFAKAAPLPPTLHSTVQTLRSLYSTPRGSLVNALPAFTGLTG